MNHTLKTVTEWVEIETWDYACSCGYAATGYETRSHAILGWEDHVVNPVTQHPKDMATPSSLNAHNQLSESDFDKLLAEPHTPASDPFGVNQEDG